MLTAMNREGELISLVQLSREETEKWRKRLFYCPECRQQVRLRMGRFRVPHFAHLSDHTCSFATENESKEHLTLKQKLAEWCLKYGIDHELEAYLPEIKQRADILIGNIALEIQCSKLPHDDMVKRTQAYIENGYQPIWICGEKNWNHGNSFDSLRQFCYYSENLGFYLWTVNWQKKQLYLRYHLEMESPNQLCYATKCWSFGEGRLNEILCRSFETGVFHVRKYSIEHEVSETYRDIYKRLRRREQAALRIQSLYYQHQMNLLGLHYWFYYRINQSFLLGNSEYLFKCALWQWLKERKNNVFTKKQLIDFMHSYLLDQKIYELFPNIKSHSLMRWQGHYLVKGLLVCNVIKSTAKEESFYVVADRKDWLKPYPIPQLPEKEFPQVIITGTALKI